jgi:hypothetical protein
MRHRNLAVHLEGGVVVDLPGVVEHAAVAVVGELVQAEVRHQHGLVAELRVQVPQGDVQDAVRVEAAGADRVLVFRDAEQHQPTDAGLDRLDRGLPQALAGVLDDAGHGRDRYRLGRALLDEHGQHQLAGPHGRLGDEPAHGGG